MAADLAKVHVHGHKNNPDENGEWIIAVLVPNCIRLLVLHQCVVHFRERHGGGKRSPRTEMLVMD